MREELFHGGGKSKGRGYCELQKTTDRNPSVADLVTRTGCFVHRHFAVQFYRRILRLLAAMTVNSVLHVRVFFIILLNKVNVLIFFRTEPT